MDRSKRAMNPNNFNEDGTIKKQGNKKVVWNKSKHYIKHQNQLKELYRKQVDVLCKYQHECLANYIISLGNNIFVEQMNFWTSKTCQTPKRMIMENLNARSDLVNHLPIVHQPCC